MGIFAKLAGAFRAEAPPAAVGRNDLCWCGSGRKYKRCHLDADRRKAQAQQRTCRTTS
jgi:hypothetical protein